MSTKKQQQNLLKVKEVPIRRCQTGRIILTKDEIKIYAKVSNKTEKKSTKKNKTVYTGTNSALSNLTIDVINDR